MKGLLAEGRMMLEAVAADAARDGSLEVTVLVDEDHEIRLPSGVCRQFVPQRHELEALTAAAARVDWTLLIAPETGGILVDRVARVRAAGGAVLAPNAAFLTIAADKQATIDALAASGVPVPAGRSLAAGEPAPAGFHLPAIRKARASAGCDGLEIIHTRDVFSASTTATRLEALVPGSPVGVSCLCGGGDPEILPPLRQRFSAGDRPHYRGSEPLSDRSVAARATALARRAVAAVERASGGASAVGWVGVDMLLGDRHDGRDDRVLEVNPRLTTSFVVQASMASTSLVRSLIDRAVASRDHASSAFR
ncbi:MAG: ATP-grasp domain-containing protein [Planctomycetota bacterium]|nr:ATP-grasp domain-containing protein [Planctomycetota bacterium]